MSKSPPVPIVYSASLAVKVNEDVSNTNFEFTIPVIDFKDYDDHDIKEIENEFEDSYRRYSGPGGYYSRGSMTIKKEDDDYKIYVFISEGQDI